MRSLPSGRGAGSGGNEGALVLGAERASLTPTQGRVGVSQLPALPALPAPVCDPGGHFWAHVPSAKTPGAWKDPGFASRAFLKRRWRGAELGGRRKGEEEGRFEQVLCRLGWQAC